jgi:hypothetical protein
MSTISIADLNPTGIDLLADSESYLQDLSTDEDISISGGTFTPTVTTIPCAISISVVTYIVTRELTKRV